MTEANGDKQNDATLTVTGRLHSQVYAVLIGLALWMVLWVWSFVDGGETDYILFIVTGFILIVVGLQLVLMRVRRADQTADADTSNGTAPSFYQWARGDRGGGNRHDGFRHRIPDRRTRCGDVKRDGAEPSARPRECGDPAQKLDSRLRGE